VDTTIIEKSARSELCKLIGSRLGLELGDDVELADARSKTLRYILVGEFRDDYEGEAPPAAGMIPSPPTKDHVKFVRELAESLRRRHADQYSKLADQVEAELGFTGAALPPEKLGRIDTFRFEERALLRYVGQLIVDRRYADAARIVGDHRRSFWTDRDLRRQNQWEACRLMADLGGSATDIRKSLPAKGTAPAAWVQEYTADDGWYRLDLLQRNLESVVASMTEEPESEAAMARVRTEYEDTVQGMAAGFVESLRQAQWAIPGAMSQTRVYTDLVEGKGAGVAFLLVDSLRYEMGVELREQLGDADELALYAAVAAVPTITPIGMAIRTAMM